MESDELQVEILTEHAICERKNHQAVANHETEGDLFPSDVHWRTVEGRKIAYLNMCEDEGVLRKGPDETM